MLIPGLFLGASPTSFAVDSFRTRPGSSDLAPYPNHGLTQKALDVSQAEFSELVPRSYRVNYGKAVVGRGEKVGTSILPTRKAGGREPEANPFRTNWIRISRK
mmetsp:Transcript_9480/g.13827  ORF Transcript_9480/g.13827 Transcript_9480/m.13827 type:complete len:103 (-) Transcript_9480:547-855(-)